MVCLPCSPHRAPLHVGVRMTRSACSKHFCKHKLSLHISVCCLPSAGGRGLRRSEVRKRVRSLKLQLFWTFPGLVASGTLSELGESRTPEPCGSGEALFRLIWEDLELFILIRSRKPILPLTVKNSQTSVRAVSLC